jgi:ribosome modulation factor
MSALVKILLAGFVLWVLAHAHVFLIYRTSLLSFLIFIIIGLVIVAGLAAAKSGQRSMKKSEETMTVQEAWQDGSDAALEGKPCKNINPWNAQLHAAWLCGWKDGRDHRHRGAGWQQT